jgi:hypothetical protein
MTKSPLLALLLGGCLVGGSNDTKTTHIIGGTGDSGDPAVGLLRGFAAGGTFASGCTATLIAPTMMLTAAHCATGAVQFDVSFDTTPDLTQPFGGTGWVLGTLRVDPAYDGNSMDGHDVAIVLLGQAVAAAPVALGATPVAGASVRAVGYGKDTFGPGTDPTGFGTKREITLAVDSVATHEIVIGADGESTCHGDSGGPVFDATGALVAVDSYGDTDDCHGASHDMRVDDNLAFIDPFVAAGGGGSGPTSGGGSGSDSTGSGGGSTMCDVTIDSSEIQCANAACTCLIDGQVIGTCTAADPNDACDSDCCGF